MADQHTVTVPLAPLQAVLQRLRDSAYRAHARYDPAVRHYPWSDDLWRAAAPHEFANYDALRRAVDEQNTSGSK